MPTGAVTAWNPPVFSPSAWWLLTGALPVLLLGDVMLNQIKPLARLDLPAPIVGGLLIATVVLLINLSGAAQMNLNNKVSSPIWNWIVTPQIHPKKSQVLPIYLPLSTAFFCCVGLNASWEVAKKGSWQLLVMLGLATVLGVFQNVLGVGLSHAMHQNPILGLICGSVTLTGGPSTAMGFAETFEMAGFPAAGVVGAAAAMFGIVAASLLAGAFGGQLIRRLKLANDAPLKTASQRGDRIRTGFLSHLRSLFAIAPSAAKHTLIILICMKLGAWLSLCISAIRIPLPHHRGVFSLTLPVYMGAMILAVLFRNLTDPLPRSIINTKTVERLATVLLALFLVIAMASLDLMQLRTLAVPMLVILGSQVILMLVFAGTITFVLMGRDYQAAIMSAGHVGFGLGITPNAVATMDVLEQKFGFAPRAVLIVTVVGGFLIDFTNSLIITLHFNYLHH